MTSLTPAIDVLRNLFLSRNRKFFRRNFSLLVEKRINAVTPMFLRKYLSKLHMKAPAVHNTQIGFEVRGENYIRKLLLRRAI